MPITISKKQILNRWDTLPDSLKEAIFSSFNVDLIWSVGAINHLTNDKISKIAMLAGDILMGFVHLEDFAPEIRKELNINPEMANSIAAEIDRKIFSPVKKDLRSVYRPPALEFKELEEERETPVLNLRKKMEEFSFKIVEDENQNQENKIDLSKKIKKENVEVPQVEPVIEKTEEKEKKKVEEPKVEPASISFETPAPAASAGSSGENGPLIIHQEVGFKPLSGKLKSLGGMFNFLRSKDEFKKEEEPVKAELEIGEEFKITEDKKEEYGPQIRVEETASVKNEISDAVKVVNYEENIETAPENLPATKEDLKEIKLEVKPEKKIEEKKPETGDNKESENMIDLGMFK